MVVGLGKVRLADDERRAAASGRVFLLGQRLARTRSYEDRTRNVAGFGRGDSNQKRR